MDSMFIFKGVHWTLVYSLGVQLCAVRFARLILVCPLLQIAGMNQIIHPLEMHDALQSLIFHS